MKQLLKGETIAEPGIPESFKVLLKELQSLALDVTVLDENGEEVKMTENIDYGDSELSPIIEGDDNFRYDENLGDAGYREVIPEEEDSFEDFGDNSYDSFSDDFADDNE